MVSDGFVIWLTGLPSAGKTTTARILENELRNRGLKIEVLDGDDVRKNLSPELGFSKREREIHVKRVAYIGHLLSRNGIVTVVALISPYRSTREFARRLIGGFVEVWVQCSIETCQKRDTKGLYKKAKQGIVSNLTGVQDPYEPPTKPEVIINTDKESKEECVKRIISSLKELKYIQDN